MMHLNQTTLSRWFRYYKTQLECLQLVRIVMFKFMLILYASDMQISKELTWSSNILYSLNGNSKLHDEAYFGILTFDSNSDH